MQGVSDGIGRDRGAELVAPICGGLDAVEDELAVDLHQERDDGAAGEGVIVAMAA